MLNKYISEADHFATDQVSTVTVSPSLLEGAANDGVIRHNDAQARRLRRNTRQLRAVSSQLGGWKVRMW